MFEIGQVPPQILTNGKMAGTGHQNGGTNGHVTIQEVSESSEESDEDYEPEEEDESSSSESDDSNDYLITVNGSRETDDFSDEDEDDDDDESDGDESDDDESDDDDDGVRYFLTTDAERHEYNKRMVNSTSMASVSSVCQKKKSKK